MKTIEELAQWVIDNRYSKSEKEKVSDSEMYHTIIDSVINLNNQLPCDHPYHAVLGEDHGNPRCLKCGTDL